MRTVVFRGDWRHLGAPCSAENTSTLLLFEVSKNRKYFWSFKQPKQVNHNSFRWFWCYSCTAGGTAVETSLTCGTNSYLGLFFSVVTRNSWTSMPVESVYSWLESSRKKQSGGDIMKKVGWPFEKDGKFKKQNAAWHILPPPTKGHLPIWTDMETCLVTLPETPASCSPPAFTAAGANTLV